MLTILKFERYNLICIYIWQKFRDIEYYVFFFCICLFQGLWCGPVTLSDIWTGQLTLQKYVTDYKFSDN